ncbi:MAG: lysophospholipid acyltransferase family protein [Syntrophorhabdaceae bacterium]
MKKKLKSFLMIHLMPPMVYGFLSLLKMTLRVKHINRPPDERWGNHFNYLVCFWHSRLLMMPFAKKGGGGKVLISRHRDGEFIARIVSYFGIGTVRGSYRKEGSVSSLREILHDLKENIDIAITPDGPKGPRFEVKKGIVELARLSHKPLLPVSYGASKKKLFIHGIASSCPILSPGSSSCGATR